MVDFDYREQSITALGTETALVAQGADTPGAFVVPADAKRITEIRIACAINCADDTAFGWTSAIHIHGAGVQLSEGWFPGPCGSVEGIAAASGSKYSAVTQKYLTNIPVRGGGAFTVNGVMNGEDIGALHMLVQIVYDGPVAGKIVDMDIRSQDLAAANTLVALDERLNGTSEGDFKPPYHKIGEIFVGAGAKLTAAATTAVGLAFHISGGGLQKAGNYKLISGHSWGLNSEFGGQGIISELERYIVELPTKVGSSIRVQAQMIEGDVGTAFAIVGFAYYN